MVPLLDSTMTLKVLDIADIEDIDNAWRYGTEAPFGPFQILDVVGLKTAFNITLNKPDVNEWWKLNKLSNSTNVKTIYWWKYIRYRNKRMILWILNKVKQALD